MSPIRSSRLTLAAVVALPLLALGACSSTPPQPVTPPAPTVVSTAKEAVGVVTRVDQRTRMVSIRTPANEIVTVQVGPEVENFARIRRNDRVRLRYEEAVAVRLAPRGEQPDPEAAIGTATAAPGERPAAAAVTTVRAQVRINSVDTTNNTVTFTGPSGVRRTVAVRSPEMQEFIRTLRPGSRMDVAYAEATAISVEPAER